MYEFRTRCSLADHYLFFLPVTSTTNLWQQARTPPPAVHLSRPTPAPFDYDSVSRPELLHPRRCAPGLVHMTAEAALRLHRPAPRPRFLFVYVFFWIFLVFLSAGRRGIGRLAPARPRA